MTDKDWIEVSIFTKPDKIDTMFALLLSLDINGAEIVDNKDFNDFLENYTDYWDYVDDELAKSKNCPTHLKVYFRDNSDGKNQLENLKNTLALRADEVGFIDLKLGNVNEDAWFENWKQFFKPYNVGENIVIIPEWENEYDAKGRLPLKINPGMLFGTGTHHTTALCIAMLEKLVKSSDEILDIGCGSGILSILSLLLGAKNAYAVDIDSAAPKIAYENASLNGIDINSYFVDSGNILTDLNLQNKYKEHKFDIVAANIVADVIIPLSALVGDFMKKDAVFICSGIIDDRVDEVICALNNNKFKVIEKISSGEWWAIRCIRED